MRRALRGYGAAFLAAASVALAAAPAWAEAEWRGSLALRADVYGKTDDPPRMLWLTGELGWRFSAPRVAAGISASFVRDSAGDTAAADTVFALSDRGPRRALMRLDEAWVRFALGRWQLQLGRQPIAWGVTDTVRPADVVMGYDWTDPVTERRLTPWAARLYRREVGWELEVFAVEPRSFSRLPPPGSRWSALTVPLDQPARNWRNAGWGARWLNHGERLEASVYVFDGDDDLPRFVARPVAQAPYVEIRGQARRQRMLGGALWGAAGPLTLRGEVAYNRIEDESSYSVGDVEAEWTPGEWRVIVGYADSSLSGGEVAQGARLDYAALPAVIVHVARGALTSWTVEWEGAYGVDGGGRFTRVSGSWPIGGNVRWTTRVEVFGGPSDSIFGAWSRHDRVTTEVAFRF